MKNALLVVIFLSSYLLSSCGKEESVAVSYLGLNQTDKSIISVVVNGEGGVLAVSAHGGGGGIVCCVMLPSKWKPGLTTTIRWQNDSTPVRDAAGNRVYKDGVPVLIEAPWRERTVEIPKYDAMGEFYIVFLPEDEVKVAVSNGIPDIAKQPH